jgi:hypothetical protein
MRILILLLITTGLAIGCREPSNNIDAVHQDTTQYEAKPSAEIGHYIEIKIDTEKKSKEKTCGFTDGTHSATADYYNPKTDHTAKYYDLQVRVKDCKVVQIDFPNGGWLDESHIPATEINDNGDATLKDDKGRTWKIHLH